MRVDIVFPVLPPALDGIGDHTAHLAGALSMHADVRVLTAQEDATPIPDVAVERAFSLERRRLVRGIIPAVAQDPPDWLLLQFNQFSYGRWGLNPYLPHVLRAIRQRFPKTRIAWLAHEDFVPRTSWKFAVMSTWQRRQFRQLGQASDLILFTIEYWAQHYRSWFPETPIACLPVGANIPNVGLTRAEARRRLGLHGGTFVVGYFGSLHNSRLPHLFRNAVERLRARTDDLLVLYVGADGPALQHQLGDVPFYDAGRLPARDVSSHFAAMDLYLAPFIDGVSARRGSFMASLQHGIATVATRGHHTDEVLLDAEGRALLLADCKDTDRFAREAERLFADARLRGSMGVAGQVLYRKHFDWPILAERLVALMTDSAKEDVLPPSRREPSVVSPS
jgi:glycosyltransferase involved in cell wall biosynthesis